MAALCRSGLHNSISSSFEVLNKTLKVKYAKCSLCFNQYKKGRMDTNSIRGLINSISRLVHLVSCLALETMPTQKDYRNIASSLKLMKLILDNIVDSKVSSDEYLCKECKELDVAVNEAREFIEKWSPKMSKICSVLWSEPLLLKIQGSLVGIYCILGRLLESSPSTSSVADVQHCVQEFQCFEVDKISEPIKEALKSQQQGLIPRSEHPLKSAESLGLTASQELLKESIALEKQRMKAENKKKLLGI